MRWQCFEIQRQKIWKGILFLEGKGLKFGIFSYNSIYFVNLFNCQCLALIQFFFFFFPRRNQSDCYSLPNGSWSCQSKTFKTKYSPKQSASFTWAGEHHLACDGNLGRQTFQSVLVSETINVSGTARSFIASAKVWDHLSKRLLLV